MHLPWRWRVFSWSIISFGFFFYKKKELTKTSGLVKRQRKSFWAVSAHSHSAVNGLLTTSEKWTWCSIVNCPPLPPSPPLLMYPMNGLAQDWEREGEKTIRGWRESRKERLVWHNSKSALRCTLLSVIGEEAAFHSLISCLFTGFNKHDAFNSSLSTGPLWSLSF